MSADPRRQIADALTRLLQAGEDSFVVITLKGTERFVQFVAPADDWLLLDVPAQALNDEERRRAEAFFADLGEFDEELQAFCAVLTEGPDAAAEVALDALGAVYQAPPGADIAIKGEFNSALPRRRGAQQAGECSICGELTEDLTRRMWFEDWGIFSTMKAQAVCPSCLNACRRRTRIHLAVLGGVVLAAGAAVVAAVLFVP